MYDKSFYNEEQIRMLEILHDAYGTDSIFKLGEDAIADVSDLHPAKYDATQMKAIAFGRSGCEENGNIDDADPEVMIGEEMIILSLRRAHIDERDILRDYVPSQSVHPKLPTVEQQIVLDMTKKYPRWWGKLEVVDLQKYKSGQLEIVSLGRGDDSEYGNIDDLHPSVTPRQMLIVSLGRGESEEYNNVDDVDLERTNPIELMILARKTFFNDFSNGYEKLVSCENRLISNYQRKNSCYKA